ncbi:MAG: hypothetical protein ACK6EB_08520, partial [Planctomyces sp.]
MTIPAGQQSVDFKLISIQDRHFESDEDVKLEVVPHRGGSYSPAESAAAKVLLIDATADLDLAAGPRDMELMDDVIEDTEGSFIPKNSDFDMQSYMADHEWLSMHEDVLTSAEYYTVRIVVKSKI